MKKILSVMLMFIMLMSLMIPAYADSEVKETEVVVSASDVTVNVNESVALSAVVPKHGSSFTDSWSAAEKDGTVLDEDTQSYFSTATFKACEAGVYTIEYNITMNAGKSNAVFVGKGSVTVVVSKPAVVGAEIRNLSIVGNPIINAGGTYYLISGKTYIIWNGTNAEEYGFVSFYFKEADSYKDVAVKMKVGLTEYSYTVRVTHKMIFGI